jgi:type II secretory pathway pseudopilin PulG
MSTTGSAYHSPDSPSSQGSTKRKGFRFVELLVVIVIIFILLGLLLPATRTAGEAARRMECTNNLKQLALALQNYEITYGSLPPAYLAAADGTPMHSWRVLLLPFIEQQALYEKYRFDEPWDGPNNRHLAKQMPSVYRCPSFNYEPESAQSEGDQWYTQYVVISDYNSSFPPSGVVSTSKIQDGASNTLLVAELSSECVPWMAPRDIDVAGFARMYRVRSKGTKQHEGGLHIALGDGSVIFLSESTESATLEGLITVSGSEPPSFK